MTPVRLLRITLPLVLIALVLFLTFRKPPAFEPAEGRAREAIAPKAAESPAARPPVETATSSSSESLTAAALTEESFVPGHFPGISVRYEPGTHRPTPPDGTPRTEPVEQEVVLPDGRVLRAVTLDESWRVPVTTAAKP